MHIRVWFNLVSFYKSNASSLAPMAKGQILSDFQKLKEEVINVMLCCKLHWFQLFFKKSIEMFAADLRRQTSW